MTKCIALGKRAVAKTRDALRDWTARCHCKLLNTKGQGTTEYAILVGVLVVIAIVAIGFFKPKIQELWNAISDGINGL